MLPIDTALLCHELCKIRGAFLAARPELHALVKYGNSRMIGALAIITASVRERVIATVVLTARADNRATKMITAYSVRIKKQSRVNYNHLSVPADDADAATVLIFKASMVSLRAGATMGCKTVNGVSIGGLGNDSLMGARTWISSFCSNSLSSLAGFSGSGGLMSECFAKVQPLILRNSVKSTDFLLQQDHPL